MNNAIDELVNRDNWHKDIDWDDKGKISDIRWDWCLVDEPPLKEAAADLAKLRSDFADISSELTRQENENLRFRNALDEARKVIVSLAEFYPHASSLSMRDKNGKLLIVGTKRAAAWLKEFGG